MGLSQLNIKLKYKSIDDDILKSFYIPVLSESKYYYRAVGYFSSSILVEYAKGLKTFIKNNGKMKLIISPYLTSSDYTELHDEFNNQKTKFLINSMFQKFLKNDDVVVASSKLLIMLLKNGCLEIKVAEPKNKAGLFHEKIGLFYDDIGNRVAISGSNNETGSAVLFNHESFNTFCSWKLGQDEYIDQHEYDFNSYWNREYKNINIIDLSEAIDKELLKKFDTNETVDDLYNIIFKDEQIISNLGFRPYDYQKEAVNMWLLNEMGIFKFATGAGKTKTAIYLMERLKTKYDKLFFIIVVPDKTLVNQWAEELEEYRLNTLRCFSGTKNWEVRFKDIIDVFSIYQTRYEYIVVTNDSFFNDKFQWELRKLKDEYMLIVDECHSWGTDRILSNLPRNRMRLGLSATPELFFSEEKTRKLLNFFGGITYEYSLERAIKEEKLVGYYYYPIFVKLSSSEKEQYDELTLKIVKLIGNDIDDISDKYSKALEMLLFKRARIIYGAQSKIDQLEKIVEELSKKGRLLIYCGPTSYTNEVESDVLRDSLTQLQTVNKLLGKMGIRFAQYTSKENEEERLNAINAFKNDTYSTLVAIKCLDEGVNIPQIERAIILASSTNPREFIQRRGRILRHHLGKQNSEIYDFIVYDEDYENLIKKEMERFYEFARLAKNSDQVINEYKAIIDKFIFKKEM